MTERRTRTRTVPPQRSFDGPTFRSLRQTAGVPLVDVVASAGRVTYRHVQQWETAHREVSIELAHRLATALTKLSGTTVTVDQFAREGRTAA